MKKKRRPRLANGWRWIQKGKAPQYMVLVTNNPRAKDTFGRMTHVWIVDSVHWMDEEQEFAGWVYGYGLIRGLKAYHELPGPAYRKKK